MNFDQLTQFFDAKVPPECPLCGHSQWDIPQIEKTDVALYGPTKEPATIMLPHPKETTGLLEITRSDSAVYAICTNCGFIRMHSTEVINKWLNQQT